MKLTVLGSGSPEACVRRASSGYLLEAGSDRILLDCGGGVFDNLLRAGFRPSDVTHLFFSHLHSDHMMDYARLVHAAWDEGGAPLSVYGPAPILEITAGYFGANGVLAHDLRARTEFAGSQQVWKARGGKLPRPWPAPVVREIEPGETVTGDGWCVETCEVPHAQPHLVCMALAVTCGGKKLTYSGDAGLCDALRALCRESDLLIHWCYRLRSDHTHSAVADLSPGPDEIARMAQAAGVRRLALAHFRVHMDSEAGHHEALEDLRGHFAGDAEILEDLVTIVL